MKRRPRAQATALHGVLLDQFIASKSKRPKELVLDIDATHIPLHGAQEKAHFQRYYDNYCYLPLYVFCGQDILACVLRPASRDPASILSALIKLIARRLRQAWPRMRIIVRGDSGISLLLAAIPDGCSWIWQRTGPQLRAMIASSRLRLSKQPDRFPNCI